MDIEQEAQLPQRDRAMRYVSNFVLCFTSYGSQKSFKQHSAKVTSKVTGNGAIR